MSSPHRPHPRQARGRALAALFLGGALVLAACSDEDIRDQYYGTDVGGGYTLPDAADARDGGDAGDAAQTADGAGAPIGTDAGAATDAADAGDAVVNVEAGQPAPDAPADAAIGDATVTDDGAAQSG
jgi:hypothetical protein